MYSVIIISTPPSLSQRKILIHNNTVEIICTAKTVTASRKGVMAQKKNNKIEIIK